MKDIDLIKMIFSQKYNLNPDIVDHIIEIFNISNKQHYINEKIRFTFTNDKYGESAKELYRKRGPLKRSYSGDAGIDLPIILSEEEMEHGKKIWAGEREILHTGIILEFPIGYWGRIVHRSSTEKNHRLRVIEGIIDDYRGEILVQVHNGNTSNATVYHGDRLSQVVLAKTAPFDIEEAKTLRPSSRNNKGFGSSGK